MEKNLEEFVMKRKDFQMISLCDRGSSKMIIAKFEVLK